MQWTLEATSGSAAIARDLVRQAVAPLGGDLVHTAVLLTDELIANAALHGAGPVQLVLTIDRGVVRVSVSDTASAGTLTLDPEPGGTQTNGRGLFLVDALSTRWGMDPFENGKRVWFELEPLRTAS